MKRVVAVLAIAACGQPARRDPKPPSQPVPSDAAAAALPESPAPVNHRQRLAVEAPHAGQIRVLAATPEGDAVLTMDELGGTRLWPALDGSKEPKVVELPQADELALVHRADGYTAIVRDETGGLYVAKLDVDGRTLQHATFGVDPPFIGMASTAGGFLAWRADHHVLWIDADGVIKGDLPAEPQTRVVDIAVAGGKALALIEADGRLKARWLTVQPTLAWGAWIDKFDSAAQGLAVALSPDASLFAVSWKEDKLTLVTIVRTSAGTAVTSAPFPLAVTPDPEFVDDHLLVIAAQQSSLQWLVAKDGEKSTSSPNVVQIPRGHLVAVSAGRAVLGLNGDLVLATPKTTHYLGYQTLAPQTVAAGPDGTLLLAGVQGAVLLDASLREVSRPNLGLTPTTPLAAAVWVGGDNWLVESTQPNAKLQLAIVNASSGATSVVRTDLPEVHYLEYEPSTQLVAMSFGSESELAKLDVGKGMLVQQGVPPVRKSYEEIVYALFAPALARGQQAVEVSIRDKPTIRWLRTPTKPGATLTISGAFLASDAAGRVYAWQQTAKDTLEVAVFTDGKQTGTLPTKGAATLWPDPTATLVAEAALGALTLYRGTTAVWSKPIEGIGEVVWLADGAFAVTHASGIARVDAKTGAITALRCGWEFGLTTKPHPATPRVEPICTQLAR